MTAPANPVKLDNRVVAVAARLGKFAARQGSPITSCPYKGDGDDAALLRVWLSAYLRTRPPAAGTVSYTGDKGGDQVAAAQDVSPQRLAQVPDDKLAAGMAKLAARGEWDAFPAVEEELARREADADGGTGWTPDGDDRDWRVDAALARGADIPSAYVKVYGSDQAALGRGLVLWQQERALTGGQGGTLAEFKAAAGDAVATLSIDNRVVATAVRLGRFAAALDIPVGSVPYVGDEPTQVALRRVWLAAYLRSKPADAGKPADKKPADAGKRADGKPAQ